MRCQGQQAFQNRLRRDIGIEDSWNAQPARLRQRIAAAIQPALRQAEADWARGQDPAQLSGWNLTMRALPYALSVEAAAEGMALELLEQVFERLGLTARSYHRVLRVALTIADLEGSAIIGPAQIAEAVQLRRAAAAL